MGRFRFEDLEIWQEASRLGDILDELSDDLEQQRKYRYCEQLRGAALSVSNNIADGAGSSSKKDFKNFLNIARRSVFENANMLLFFGRKGLIDKATTEELLEAHRVLSARISKFASSLEP